MSSQVDIESLRKALVGAYKKDEVSIMNDIIAQLLDFTNFGSEAVANKLGQQVHEINKKYSDTSLYGDLLS